MRMTHRMLFDEIAACENLNSLNLLACSNLWKSDRTIFQAIRLREEELAPSGGQVYEFGDEDYHAAVCGASSSSWKKRIQLKMFK